MNDPTADDLEKLLEWMDKQQERTAGNEAAQRGKRSYPQIAQIDADYE